MHLQKDLDFYAENATICLMKERKNRVLLIGGHGFLGSGLCRELKRRNIAYKAVDILDFDLTDENNVDKLSTMIGRYTHVVLLAARVGRGLFDAKNGNFISPIVHAEQNHAISFNVAHALTKRFYAGKQSVDFTYYSSSEVYGSGNECSFPDSMNFNINVRNPRSLYAIEKLADETMFRSLRELGAISHLKVLRPFNVSGTGQKRGVVFEMFRDAFTKKSIWFSKDTVRTLTDIDYASKRGVDAILRASDKTMNVVDPNGNVMMCNLAFMIGEAVEKITGEKVKVVEEKRDPSIEIRCIDYPDGESNTHVEKMVRKWVSEFEKEFIDA